MNTLITLGPGPCFFKTNDIDSLRFVKISNVNISNTPISFVEKNGRRFCIAKDSLFFFNKNISVVGYKVINPLTR